VKHLVVGVDGSASSEMAVYWASALASATGAKITVAHVVDHGDCENDPGLEALTEREDALWVEALNATRVAHDSRLLHGDPPTRILDIAAEVGADMIVIGRRAHVPVAPRLLGSFTRQLLQRNTIPVAIVPAPSEQVPREELASTAVVGVDGTESARSVLEVAVSLSEDIGLDMHVLTVVDIHADAGTETGGPQRPNVGSAQRLLRRLVGAVDPAGGHRIAARADVGMPADELLRLSQHAEVLVVGHRRRTPISTFLTHATGRYCAAHATCPVVMVPIEPPPITANGGSLQRILTLFS